MGKGSGRPTLTSLARELNLHPSTVSRALSTDPAVRGSISHETVTQVSAVARLRGYVSNRTAATLRTGKSRSLAVLVPYTSEWVVGAVYEGIDSAATANGYSTYLANTFDDPDTRRDRVLQFAHWGVDAILYADSRADEEDLDAVMGIPCWPIIREGRSPHGSTVDDELGGALVAQHLVENGYMTAAAIAGPPLASTFAHRVAGFVREYRRLGGTIDDRDVVPSGLQPDDGTEAARRIVTGGPPAAIFAAHDILALGTYRAAGEAGLAIGGDIGLVGYNDADFASTLSVPLTSVRWDFRELGAMIATNIVHALEGTHPPAMSRLEPQLVARESSTAARQ